jgi:hypothetical protein
MSVDLVIDNVEGVMTPHERGLFKEHVPELAKERLP